MPDSDQTIPMSNVPDSPMDIQLRPVTPPERKPAVDIIRGVAVFGILPVNILMMALPFEAMDNPSLVGGATGLNLIVWQVVYSLFYMKFMAIFSMLFGAGLALMFERAEHIGKKLGKTYYRRILWLLVIGLVHALLIWYGDILVQYALCGLLLYPLRKLSPRWLIGIGTAVFLVGALTLTGMGVVISFLQGQAQVVQQKQEAGEELSPGEVGMLNGWRQVRENTSPSPERIQENIKIHRGSYGDIFTNRALMVLMMNTAAMVMLIFWRVMGMMLIGMGLMKLMVFSAERSTRFYLLLVIFGYGIGLPAVIWAMIRTIARDFDPASNYLSSMPVQYIFSFLVALGHIGLVMLIIKKGWLKGLSARLRAVGRMALTNYLMHSIVFTLIFYGYGLSLYAQVERFHLGWFVLGMWILQLYTSPWWLKRFRFGPAEWLWRSLTYRSRQPMRVTEER